MTPLADDPTAAAILSAVPCHPVPPSGRSPAIDALRAARAGHGLAIGHDGVMMIVRRPWLALDCRLTPPIPAYLPYGSIGEPRGELRSGLIPAGHLAAILAHFTACLPNEAAAFVLWSETTRDFSVHFPEIEEATPSRLVYRTPALPPDSHIVCDLHSHPDGPAIASRLCAGGMFLPVPRSPFAGE